MSDLNQKSPYCFELLNITVTPIQIVYVAVVFVCCFWSSERIRFSDFNGTAYFSMKHYIFLARSHEQHLKVTNVTTLFQISYRFH